LVTSLAVPPRASAQAHIVSQEDLQTAIVAATQTREKNREKIVSFFSTPRAQNALRSGQVDIKLVKNAVSSLSDDELARLAARADKADADFAAGRISDRDLLWILVGIAVLVDGSAVLSSDHLLIADERGVRS
jgi:hypothetical protein